MSLLQDVLRTQTLDSLDKTLAAVPSSQQIETDSDDELVNVSRASGTGSGYQTPQELREEKWKSEAEGQIKPSKVEMRELYKELGGRKVRGKGKISTGGTRDKGGWGEDAGGTEDY
ncbi:hypothetical protein EW026_g3286 [Hermanssonia centrifuga]|uniref:Uncharacterized protein n=1 Tax=Hermanssonia centrifuga TaxID=98765 RepID=A0A4S4KKM2_9APHY|nr:hypothetical protein EW026_g3286 [Hermanssonia centrifuga]